MEFLTTDTIRVLILVGLTGMVVAGYLFRKIKKDIAVIGILLLVAIEIFAITNRQVSKLDFINENQLEETAFRQTEITQVLSAQKDKENMRALVISGDFQSNYYAYFYPTINGYSAIKLQVIQDIIDHSLFKFPTQDRLNWNVINMLNGKYIISPNPLPYPFLKEVAKSESRNEILYLNENVLPKAWFIEEVKSFVSPEELVLFMNNPEFNPKSSALIVDDNIEQNLYSGKGNIEIISYSPNKIELKISTVEEQYLVLSEVYYPDGWKVTKEDGIEL